MTFSLAFLAVFGLVALWAVISLAFIVPTVPAH